MSVLYELDRVVHGYDGRTVLDIAHLVVRGGALTTLIGANGAGKSTLLRLLAGVEAPSSGKILFQGRSLRSSGRTLRRRIGWVMQQPYLLRGSACDNVMLGLKLHRLRPCQGKALAALRQVGFDADPGLPVNTLSGGQRQLVALARCLVLEPEVLLLDEPFNHLDVHARRRLEKWLRDWVGQKGGSAVFSGHDVSHSLSLADEVIALGSGRPMGKPLVNVFSGYCRGERFITGRLEILLPGPAAGDYATVDPRDIVLSLAPLRSSMRNRFAGRVLGLVQMGECVRVSVQAGERFEALVTRASCKEMGLSLDQLLWVNFKSTAVEVF